MSSAPPPYAAPTITASGLTIPSYASILAYLVAQAQNIFGADVYLGTDSADYQLISVFASMLYDSFLTEQSIFNARGPATALGSGLDVVVGLNGIQRLAPVYSTCPVVLTGTANTVISGGIVSDTNGNQWTLPTPAVIGATGTVTVTATCQTAGAIAAAVGTITTIVTPTLGWTGVTNAVAATSGTAAETDSALRARQAVSTAQPSQSILEGLEGAIAALPGVTRFAVYENQTATTDANGLPAHSVTCVVDGTATQGAIAQAIWAHKGPGSLSHGAISVPVTDQYGVVTNIGFDTPTYELINVVVTLQPLGGYVTGTTDAAIQAAVASYLNSLAIGVPVYLSGLWGAALSANPTPANPVFAVTNIAAGLASGGATLSSSLASIPLAYNQVAQGAAANVTVTTTT